MHLLREVTAFSIIFISTGFAAEQSESKAKPKVEDLFKVNWSSLTYNKTVSVRNPAITKNQRSAGTSERLSLSCQIEILDPNLVLGTCATPVIEQAKDGSNADVIIMSKPGPARRSNYEAPRFIRRFSTPPQSPKWKTAIRSTLRLSPPPPPRPQLVNEIQPMPMDIQLDVGLSKQAGGEISRVKGYFYALVAESLEYVDVPFKPSDDWVRLTEDMNIRLKEAQCTDSSFRFNIEVTPKNTASQPILVEGYLPGRMVVARQFIDQAGKPTEHFSAFRHLPAHISGSGSGGGSNSQIKSIRFVIGVNPRHCKIPFVLEDIPIPKP